MTEPSSLKQRARVLSDDEFAQIPWVTSLTADEREHVRQDMLVTIAEPGGLCGAHWPPRDLLVWFDRRVA